MTSVPPTQRRLVVMRHARAESHASSDVERALTPAGHKDAAAVGAWLREVALLPDHAVVSAARRTRQTWAALSSAAALDVDADLRLDLYEAGPESALDELRLVPATALSVLLIGHNPTVSYLAQLLQDGLGDPAALSAMTAGYPPAALTAMTFSGEWSDLSFGDATVTHFHVARG